MDLEGCCSAANGDSVCGMVGLALAVSLELSAVVRCSALGFDEADYATFLR